MKKLEKELEELVRSVGDGGGFGDPEASTQHQREIDLLKFKIARRDQMKTAVVSALIGAGVAAVVTLVSVAIN
ncbi:hypothetical protein [Rhodovulum steppense]|uniref:hypothetical protein n=1 Tax=Rhodovulum steppense TaxID=540251 RepID=UPI001042D467|nr:hypothetical protein [Rhodovulum steppense]